MPIDIKDIDDRSSMTMCSTASQEEANAGPSRWRRIRKWCLRVALLCADEVDKASVTSIEKKDGLYTPEEKPRGLNCIRTHVGEWNKQCIAKVRDWLLDARSASNQDIATEGLMQDSETDLDFEILTLSSECGSPITPTGLLMTQWEMVEVIQAVEDDGSDNSLRRMVARPPQLDTLSEVDEDIDEDIDAQEFSYPVIDFKERELGILYEEEEDGYDADNDDSGYTEDWGQDTSFESNVEPESMYSDNDYDDEIPPELAHVLQQISPSKQPWIRKRCRSAPSILNSQTFATPPATPPRPTRAATPSTPETVSSDVSMMDTSVESSFEALRRFWEERCEADSSFGSISSGSSAYFAP